MFPSVVTATHTHTHTICYGQDEMACHLHPIICTWNAAVTTAFQSLISFHLGCSYARKKKKKEKWSIDKQLCCQLETWLRWSVACRLGEKKSAGLRPWKVSSGIWTQNLLIISQIHSHCVNEGSTWHSQQVRCLKPSFYSTSYLCCFTQSKSYSSF